MSVRLEDYRSDTESAWCPGCGNFPILKAVKETLVALDLPPERVVICTGIGQAPKLPHYMRVNTFNGLHGREVASATAVKMASPDLTVLVHAGEGGAYGEGGNHLLHAFRRNIDITLVVHDNKHYALTKGQASPTTRVQAAGVTASPLNPLSLAISQECSFVAQATSALPDQLVDMLKKAIGHKGFSLLNVLQPCVVWDKVHTFAYYKERCYPIGPEHDPSDVQKAFSLSMDKGEKIPVGILYEKQRPVFNPGEAIGLDKPMRELVVDPVVVKRQFHRFQ
jgi:2-oxoglutarate/2-oxoacid ferredoxin oxidoreductase subunit beta